MFDGFVSINSISIISFASCQRDKSCNEYNVSIYVVLQKFDMMQCFKGVTKESLNHALLNAQVDSITMQVMQVAKHQKGEDWCCSAL